MMQNKKQMMVVATFIVVILIGISYAYYEAIVQGTGNANAETSANTATIGEVEFNGTSTFDSSTLDDIYPGFIGIQTFTVSPYRDGTGIYEIDLEANVPQAFGNDIKLTLYKTSNSTSNYITRTEGNLTQGSTGFYKQDIIVTTGTLTKVYESSLTTTTETMLEQVEFVIANNTFTTPTVTPDGYYTYYAVYEYINRETSQNSQQDLDFDSKITVKYVAEKMYTAADTLALLHGLNPNIVLTESTEANPDFSRPAPKSTPGIVQTKTLSANDKITYASDFTYDRSTGIYTLVNYTSCKYSECNNDLVGKYIVSGGLGSVGNEVVYQSKPSSRNAMLKIVSIDASGNAEYIEYIGPELNNVIEGTWLPQTSGLFSLEDDYGDSYYFRGDIDYNYVKFGKWKTDYYDGVNTNSYSSSLGQFTSLSACQETEATNCIKFANAGDDMYWRIIRINGDGSLRLIYDGTSAHGKSDLEPYYLQGGLTPANARSIGSSSFSDNCEDNAYVGYMYGTQSSSSYEDTHANLHDSSIKSKLDSWYQLQMGGYTSYITDTLFCNDRSLSNEDTINYTRDNWGTTWGSFSNRAYGMYNTMYGGYGRLTDENERGLGNTATLKCPQKHDAFTVSDTINGNGDLTYPVGLITSDEVNVAGGVDNSIANSDFYLRTDGTYWTITPHDYREEAGEFEINGDGFIGDNYVNDERGIRPVINIKGNAIKSGSGTANNPFSIE